MRRRYSSSVLVTLLSMVASSACSDGYGNEHREDIGQLSARATLVPQNPPVPPLSGSDFVAQRAFVGDPLLGMGPGQAGNLYTLNADDPSHMASTTKSFTLLMAAEATGITLDDIVTISDKAGTINNNHGGGHTVVGLPVGEQLRFQHLLYGMMLDSGGDASIAIAQHIAVAKQPALASESDAEQEQTFVNMMNNRAEELGLTNTTFFNPYGGDHEHADDNTPGDKVDHQASTRNMAQWFDFGMQYPLFRQVAGFPGPYTFSAEDGSLYSVDWSFGYPGTVGVKGGSGGSCVRCRIHQSRRIGRDLIVAYTQGQADDEDVLLDYGFASLFHPTNQAVGPEYDQGFVDHDLACVTANRAASVVVRPNGQLRILIWGLNLSAKTITHLNPVVTPATPGGLLPGAPGGGDGTGGRGGPTEVARNPTDPRDPGTLIDPNRRPPIVPGSIVVDLPPVRPTVPDSVSSGGTPLIASKAQIAYAQEGNLVVIAETDQGIWLHSIGIKQDDTIVFRDSRFVGQGSDAQVLPLHGTLIVTAHRGSTGRVTVQSRHLNPATGLLSNALDEQQSDNTIQAGNLALSGRAGLSISYDVLTAGRSPNDARRLNSFNVHRISGAIEKRSATDFGGPSFNLALSFVPQNDDATRDLHALAFENGNGMLAMTALEVDKTDGAIVWRGGTTSLVALAPDTRIAAAAYRVGGVMLAFNPAVGSSQALQVWALDRSATGSSITPNWITYEPLTDGGPLGVCRVPNAAAEGDFLLANNTGGITLRAWRSGPRN